MCRYQKKKKGQDAKPTQYPTVISFGQAWDTGDYFLLYMLTFPYKELYYFYRKKKKKPEGGREGRRKGRKKGTGGTRKRKGKRKILKGQYNIGSSLTNIMAGKGHLL